MPKRFFFSTFWIAFDFSLRFSSSLPRACAASEGVECSKRHSPGGLSHLPYLVKDFQYTLITILLFYKSAIGIYIFKKS
jgi:hypothetical protein